MQRYEISCGSFRSTFPKFEGGCTAFLSLSRDDDRLDFAPRSFGRAIRETINNGDDTLNAE